jgi:hypothetical protein
LNILKLEKDTTTQLKQFLNLKIFPSQEYILMRKDIKNYKDIILQLKNEKNNENEKNGKFLKKNEISLHAVIDYNLILEIANIEQNVVERKCTLFMEKRQQEEEAKAVHMKRMIKAKVYICIYIYIYMYIYMYIYIYIYIHVYIYICMYIYKYVYTYINMYVDIHVYTNI